MIINANSLHIPLADKCVQCVVTSPPYYGLRDYGTARWEGGDPECKHTVGSGDNDNLKLYVTRPERDGAKRQYCQNCGAVRIDSQIGLEQTPEEYVANLVAVFREVKRVLKDDGVLWLNLGDSYMSGGGESRHFGYTDPKYKNGRAVTFKEPTAFKHPSIKPKDLIGIPWMVAFALRADGWYLRQDIIWHKPNPMPESVKDRCTKSHEYIFLLTKSAKYYYDYEAVMEPSKYPEDDRGARAAEDHKRFPTELINGIRASGVYPYRNKRSVWTVTTKPYKGAHYATFPPDLIEPMILAGSRIGDIVLDPFVGSGTTVMVARKHNREGIGLDLNIKYLHVNAKERLAEIQPVLSMEA